MAVVYYAKYIFIALFGKIDILLQVLKASKNKPNDSLQNENQKTSNDNNNKSNKDNLENPPSKRQRIIEKITYDDLEDNDGNQNKVGQKLNLSKVCETCKLTNYFALNGTFGVTLNKNMNT